MLTKLFSERRPHHSPMKRPHDLAELERCQRSARPRGWGAGGRPWSDSNGGLNALSTCGNLD